MFPPPWNGCSWTVSALCPCRDRACLLQPSPEPKIPCSCQSLTSGKFPSREPGLSHFGCDPSVLGFLWDIWPLGITKAFWPRPHFSDAPHSPGLSPTTDQCFYDSTWPVSLGTRKIRTPIRIFLPASTHLGSPNEQGETGRQIHTSHAWAATEPEGRLAAAATALLSPDPGSPHPPPQHPVFLHHR